MNIKIKGLIGGVLFLIVLATIGVYAQQDTYQESKQEFNIIHFLKRLLRSPTLHLDFSPNTDTLNSYIKKHPAGIPTESNQDGSYDLNIPSGALFGVSDTIIKLGRGVDIKLNINLIPLDLISNKLSGSKSNEINYSDITIYNGWGGTHGFIANYSTKITRHTPLFSNFLTNIYVNYNIREPIKLFLLLSHKYLSFDLNVKGTKWYYPYSGATGDEAYNYKSEDFDVITSQSSNIFEAGGGIAIVIKERSQILFGIKQKNITVGPPIAFFSGIVGF